MKRFVAILLLLVASLPSPAQRPKVGVVLCGGGAKGAVHIGVLKVLEETGIPIDYIAGTSMGAILGGLYAMGYTADELDSLILAQDWDMVMSDRVPRSEVLYDEMISSDKYVVQIPFGRKSGNFLDPEQNNPGQGPMGKGGGPKGNLLESIPMAMVEGHNIYNLLTRLSVGYQDSLDFNKMPIPFACVAVDLVSKKEVVFHSGRVVDAIRSSMAIPVYFSPMKMGDMVLIDGGALNNYPVDVAKQMGADIIIGSKLIGDREIEEAPINNIGSLLDEVMNLYMNVKYEEAIKNTDILITPNHGRFNTLSFDVQSLDSLIQIGYNAATEKLDEIKALKASLDSAEANAIGPMPVAPSYKRAIHIDSDSVEIRSVTYRGLSRMDSRAIQARARIKEGSRVTGRMIDEEVARFYNTGAFKSVTYSLEGTEEPYDMVVDFSPRGRSALGVGFRFDTEEIASVYLNLGINEKALYGHKFNISAKLAYNVQAKASYTYAFESLAQFDASYQFRNTGLILSKDTYRSSMSFNDNTFNVGFSTRFKKFNIALGSSLDLYNYSYIPSTVEIPEIYDMDMGHNKFLDLHASADADERDDSYFPHKGYKLHAGYRYVFNSLLNPGTRNFSVVDIQASGVIPMGRHLAVIGTLDNRTIIGGNVPFIYANSMGGVQPGRYMIQQIPFVGFGGLHFFKNVLTVATADVRYNFLNNHYVFLSGAYGLESEGWSDLFEDKPIIGARAGYALNTRVGPIALNVFWSNYTDSFGAYVSIGYYF